MRAAETVRARVLARRARELLRVPMHRDALALVVNSAVTAAAGLVYWIIAAKTYSAQVVGTNAALIAAMMFLAGVACLDLPNILVRFLPAAATRTRCTARRSGCFCASSWSGRRPGRRGCRSSGRPQR